MRGPAAMKWAARRGIEFRHCRYLSLSASVILPRRQQEQEAWNPRNAYVQILADDNEEAFTGAVACARCIEAGVGRVIWACTVSYSRQLRLVPRSKS